MEHQSAVEPEIAKPRIFVGIPTGAPKLYSIYYMIAALANLDYKNMEIHFAVTGSNDDPKFEDFHLRLKKLVEAVKWNEDISVSVHYLVLTTEQRMRNFGPILENKVLLRSLFLDSNCKYFLLLGGDNPPPRNAINELLKAKADVSMGTCYQRPGVAQYGVYPLVWRYVYSLKDLEKVEVDSVNRELMRIAWRENAPVINASFDSNFKKHKILRGITGGDGCALISRQVLETVDWGVRPPDGACNSEDMYFMGLALYYGYRTACLPQMHIPHLAEDGIAY